MKIVTHLSSVHSRYDIRIFRKECVSLAKAECIVYFVVADGRGDETKDGVHIVDAGSKPASRLRRMLSTVGLVFSKAISTNADIFHLHDPELLPLVPSLMERGKVIYDAHEDLPRQILGKHWIPKALRRAVSFLSEKVENHYAGKATGIVAATPFIAERFRKINNSVVNINNFPLMEEFVYIERGPSGGKLACYIGGISSGRGIYEMVQAMGLVEGKLLLAGDFASPTEREKIQRLPGWKNVIELGFCNREKVKEILASTKVGLVLFHPLPNHTQAQPNKLFEYMAAGLPVITSDFPLWREIVDTVHCGKCVNPLDSQQIADAISWMLDNPEEAKRMGESGRRAVNDRFNWENERCVYLDFINDVIEKRAIL